MHKVRIRRAKLKLQVTKEILEKTKIVVAPSTPPHDVEKKTESSKPVLNPVSMLEAMPTTKADDITSLIRSTPSEESSFKQREQTPAPRALEPRIREVSSSSSTAEARPYEPSSAQPYSSGTAAGYTGTQQTAGHDKNYDTDARSGNASSRSPILQPPWRDEDNHSRMQHLPEDSRIAPDVHNRYDTHQYSPVQDQDRAS